MKGSLCRLAETSFLWRDTAMRIRERFNPRAPCGARQPQQNEPRMSDLFQPTCLLRGATIGYACRAGVLEISTHAPLAGRDPQLLKLEILLSDFNPRAPCGARPVPGVFGNTGNLFQPTRPLRGATMTILRAVFPVHNFNPRAPCGARQQKCTNQYAHFCDNRQISDAFAQNAACQSILLLFDAGKPRGFGCEPPK